MQTRTLFYKVTALLGVAVLTAACKKDPVVSDPGQFAKIYMPQAVEYPSAQELIITDTAQTLVYGAAYGGVEYPAGDISVHFALNPAMADSFNQLNGTSYEIMPEGSYDLQETDALIPAGQLATPPLSLRIKTLGMIVPGKSYLLPVSIEQAGGSAQVNEALRTTYFLISGRFEYLDKTAWTVKGFSSEEAVGEGPDNGHAANAIDDDPGTFWHTQWYGGNPGPPHYIIIDMSENKMLHGFRFLPRSGKNTGNAKNIRIEVSKDAAAWTEAGTFELPNTDEPHTEYLTQTLEARYFKITVESAYGDTFFTYFAEITAF